MDAHTQKYAISKAVQVSELLVQLRTAIDKHDFDDTIAATRSMISELDDLLDYLHDSVE